MKRPDIRRTPSRRCEGALNVLLSVGWTFAGWLFFLLLFTTCGCQTLPRITDPIEFTPTVRYPVGDPRSVVGEPILLVSGDVAPADGYLLTPVQWGALLAEFERLSAALSECYEQVDEDRDYCTLRAAVIAEQLVVCRKEHARTFWTGFSTGAGACGAAIGGAAILRQ